VDIATVAVHALMPPRPVGAVSRRRHL